MKKLSKPDLLPHVRKAHHEKGNGTNATERSILNVHSIGKRTEGVFPSSMSEQYEIAERDRKKDADLQPRWGTNKLKGEFN